MTLHPQAKAFLDSLAEQNGPGWEELSPQEGRELFSSLTDLFGDAPQVAGVEDRFVHDDLAVRIYSPSGDGPFPAIVYFHGGGWVMGDLDTHDALCRRLSIAAESVVVSVGYRRPPEVTFPAPLEDCYAATQFVAEQSESLHVDPAQITIAGDSAGGNLAAAVAMMARDRNGPEIRFQLLIYPVLNHQCDSASYTEFADGRFGLSKAAMQWFWKLYLGDTGDGNSQLVAPLLADDLQGLPATHVITAEYDVLRDEGEAYVARLQAAGVPVTHQRYDGMIHGFVHFAGLFDVARKAMDDIAVAILRVIRSRPAPTVKTDFYE
jgi:acetyl esterase